MKKVTLLSLILLTLAVSSYTQTKKEHTPLKVDAVMQATGWIRMFVHVTLSESRSRILYFSISRSGGPVDEVSLSEKNEGVPSASDNESTYRIRRSTLDKSNAGLLVVYKVFVVYQNGGTEIELPLEGTKAKLVIAAFALYDRLALNIIKKPDDMATTTVLVNSTEENMLFSLR